MFLITINAYSPNDYLKLSYHVSAHASKPPYASFKTPLHICIQASILSPPQKQQKYQLKFKFVE